jgi:microcystin-dependent protein
MANPFVAEVRAFPFNFPPIGWAFCNGQLLPISQNTALFSLLGTMYGGDGKSTYGLPNLQGNLANGQGQGPGLSLYDVGQTGGVQTVTLLTSEMPMHNHGLMAVESPLDPPDKMSPVGNVLASRTGATNMYSTARSPIAPFGSQAISPAGGSLPHNNMMPYLTLNFCIALQGVYPARS